SPGVSGPARKGKRESHWTPLSLAPDPAGTGAEQNAASGDDPSAGPAGARPTTAATLPDHRQPVGSSALRALRLFLLIGIKHAATGTAEEVVTIVHGQELLSQLGQI